MTVKALWFDLDNTLYSWDQAYDQALNVLGHNFDRDTFSRARRDVKKRLPEHHISARNRLLYFKRYLELQKEFSAARSLKLMDKLEKEVVKNVKIQVRARKTRALLQHFSSLYPLSLLTNENLRTQLLKIQVLDPQGEYFSQVLTSEEAGIEKPKFEIFQLLLKEQKLHTSQVLFVGDSFTHDIQPCVKLDISCVLTTEYFKSPLTAAELRFCKAHKIPMISQLKELKTWLERTRWLRPKRPRHPCHS